MKEENEIHIYQYIPLLQFLVSCFLPLFSPALPLLPPSITSAVFSSLLLSTPSLLSWLEDRALFLLSQILSFL